MTNRPRRFPSKNAHELFKAAEAAGLEFVRFCNSSHMLMRHPVTGKTVMIAGTSVNRRGYANTLNDIRRAGEEDAAA